MKDFFKKVLKTSVKAFLWLLLGYTIVMTGELSDSVPDANLIDVFKAFLKVYIFTERQLQAFTLIFTIICGVTTVIYGVVRAYKYFRQR